MTGAGWVAAISAGWGFSSLATVDELAAALASALRGAGGELTDVALVAVPAGRPAQATAERTATRLGLRLVVVPTAELAAVAPRLASASARSLRATGSPSASEAAALAAAGPGARLLGPRIAVGRATCALAVSGALA